MTEDDDELDYARAGEAYRLWIKEGTHGHDVIEVGRIAARLAREGWVPPAPEDDPQ